MNKMIYRGYMVIIRVVICGHGFERCCLYGIIMVLCPDFTKKGFVTTTYVVTSYYSCSV